MVLTVRYLAAAVDAAHFSPWLNAWMPFLAVVKDVAFESTASQRQDIGFSANLCLFT